MREIKFRAWDIQDKRMIYFNAFEQWGFIDHTKDSTRSSTSCDCLLLSTNPEEFVWMQITGLHDKNGKEIYEGDIVKFYAQSMFDSLSDMPLKEFIEPVTWNEEELCWWVGYQPDKETDDNQLEVIGNIYENPGILK